MQKRNLSTKRELTKQTKKTTKRDQEAKKNWKNFGEDVNKNSKESIRISQNKIQSLRGVTNQKNNK